LISQTNYYDLKLRELYDDTFLKSINSISNYCITSQNTPGSFSEYTAYNIGNGSVLDNARTSYFESLAGMLMSLTDMYEATEDVGYLYEFIYHINRLMYWRGKFYDSSYTSVSRGWVTDPNLTYMDGFIYLAISRFVWLVKNKYYSQLYSLSLNPNNHPDLWFALYSTFGACANYLETEAKDYYVYMLQNNFLVHKYQIGSDNHPNRTGGLSNLTNNANVAKYGFTKYSSSGVMNLNMQLLFFAGMAYLYDVNNTYYSFKDRIQQAANLFSRFRIIYDITCNGPKCLNCNWHAIPILGGNMIGKNVIVNYSSNNSYYWYYQGWNEHQDCIWQCTSNNCNAGCDSQNNAPPYNDFNQIEDIGHAFNDYEFIFALNETDLKNYSGSSVYPASEMLKYSNTITKNVWKGNSNFANNLDGSEVFYHNNECKPINFNSKYIFSFIKLWPFDNSSPSLYFILMNHFINTQLSLSGTVLNTPDANRFFTGIARLLSAQTVKQCPNVHLRNRELAYDQNFKSKYDLIIEPGRSLLISSYPDSSIMQPRINTPSFTINSGVNSEFIAGNKIVFKPGFKAKKGSHVKASINGSYCPGSRSDEIYNTEDLNNNMQQNIALTYFENDSIYSETFLSDNDDSSSFSIKVFPNPNTENVINIHISDNYDNTFEFVLTDLKGTEIQRGTVVSGNCILKTNLTQGLYIIKVHNRYNSKVFKLIKN
jgi:hypothetical protein